MSFFLLKSLTTKVWVMDILVVRVLLHSTEESFNIFFSNNLIVNNKSLRKKNNFINIGINLKFAQN